MQKTRRTTRRTTREALRRETDEEGGSGSPSLYVCPCPRPFLAGAVLVMLASLVLASSAAATRDPTPDPIRVLMIGNSITNGYDVEPWEAYPSLVGVWLGEGYEVIEEGCGGSKVGDWHPDRPDLAPCEGFLWNLYPRYVERNLPVDIVTVMLATNDAVESTNNAEFLDDFVDLMDALVEEVEHVVVMTPPDLPENMTATQRAKIFGFANMIRFICSNRESLICGPDVFRLLDPELHFPILGSGRDLHPNAAGHEQIAVELYDTIVQIPEPSLALLEGTAVLVLCGVGARSRARARPR
jgi:lysophospholipase L1-like esterase